MSKKKEEVLELKTSGKWSVETLRGRVWPNYYGGWKARDEVIKPPKADLYSFRDYINRFYKDTFRVFDSRVERKEIKKTLFGNEKTRWYEIPFLETIEMYHNYKKKCDEIERHNKMVYDDAVLLNRFCDKHFPEKKKRGIVYERRRNYDGNNKRGNE